MIPATAISSSKSGNPVRTMSRWLLLGEWRSHPVRALVAIAAIAAGVALGYAVDLINGAAFNEFSAAARSLSGQSDLQVRDVQGLFDETLYPQLAAQQDVAVASPILELNVTVPDQQSALKVLGIDVFRASRMTPDLMGVADPAHPFDTLADDAIFLSPAAQEWLQVRPGDKLAVRNGTGIVSLRVAGGLVRARVGQRIAVMDIGAAQWRFDRIGKLSRVDLKLQPGVNRDVFKRRLETQLPANLQVTESQDQDSRNNNMSRAYRINLNVLALVALFTGAFLVFSTQALSVIRRRSQFALLRVLGLRRAQLLCQVLLEGGLLGCLGALSGLVLGYCLAAAALHFFGGDLGGGYFRGVQASVQFDLPAALVFFALGSGIALLGSLAPALEAARAQPAAALKSGSEETPLARLATPWPALGCLLLGTLLTRLPPLFGLPVFGYLAVALLLIGGITLMPRMARLVFSAVHRLSPKFQPNKRRNNVVAALALAHLANVPGQASIALGGVLSSFSLIVAMAIMVSSFRISVDDWMQQLLSADLYVRSAGSGETGAMRPVEQHLLATATGVARADFLRTSTLALDPARPPVILIARRIDAADPARTLPLVGPQLAPSAMAPGALPIWVSEAMIDLYRYRLGQRVILPLAGHSYPFVVAGTWRDYARQSGAIQLRLADYQRLSGDTEVTDAALHIQRGVDAAAVIAALRALPFGKTLEFSQPGEIRALTLKIFDRSFAVTYLLEIVAIVIGLFGIAATFSAQTLARAKEFGMLRHIGVTRRQILGMLALEGGLLTALGMIVGFVLGWVISLILVFIVNPQSFHWTMELHMPWLGLAVVALLLLLSASATALLAGSRAVSIDVLHSVREDW